MNAADAVLAAVKDPDLVSPGVWGFVITFLIAVAVVLLVLDMVRRIRRVRYREDIGRRLDAEQHEHDTNTNAPHRPS